MSLYLLLRRTDQKLLDTAERNLIYGYLLTLSDEQVIGEIQQTDNYKLFESDPELGIHVSPYWNTNTTHYTIFQIEIKDEDLLKAFIPIMKRRFNLEGLIHEDQTDLR